MNVIEATANTSQLITLAEVKARLGISGSDNDSALGWLIEEATSEIQRYVERPLGRRQYVETLGSEGGLQLILSRRPVEATSLAVTLNGDSVSSVAISDAGAGLLYLETGWTSTAVSAGRFSTYYPSPAQILDYEVTYYAGYVLPPDIEDWAATTSKELGSWVRSTTGSPLLFECTAAGTTDGDEPTWPTSAGDTVTDNDVTWTARAALELPSRAKRAAFITVSDWWKAKSRESSLRSAWFDGTRVSFDPPSQIGLSPEARALISDL